MSGAQKDLNADYAHAGFGGRLGFGAKPALIIIDFVRAYYDKDSPLYAGIEETLTHAVTLLNGVRKAGAPVIHTNVVFTPGGIDGGMFYKKVKALRCFERGQPNVERYGQFCPGLEPKSDEPILTKQYASAFFGTSLASTLTAAGIDTLLIAGLSTSGCVRATSIDTVQHGFRPMVVKEAVGDRDPRVHDANLFDINAKYGDVVSLHETLDYLASLKR